MTIDRWKELVGDIKDNFEVQEEDSWFEDECGGTNVEVIVFKSPIGLMRLELSTKPRVINKQTHYSNRIGSESEVIYTYSPTEKVSELVAFKWDDSLDDWREVDFGNMNIN